MLLFAVLVEVDEIVVLMAVAVRFEFLVMFFVSPLFWVVVFVFMVLLLGFIGMWG